MLNPTDRQVMLVALAPYLALAAWDGWLHEKARRVPTVEKLLHALLAVTGVSLVYCLFFEHATWALASLIVFAAASAYDELGFHAALDPRERRLHFAAYACFAMFIGVAYWRGALAWT